MVLPYTLNYYGADTTATATDISKYVESIDKFTDVGTGEVVSAKIMLDARFGDFVTETNSGDTPIIQQYDLLELTITDDDDNSYTRFLIADDIIPQRNENGDHLTLELFGRERYLQKMYFLGHYFFISYREMIIKIRDYYNINRGSSQPSIRVSSFDLSDVPPDTYGIFDFGEKTTVYDALMMVVKRLSLPVAAGGAGAYFGLTFSDVSDASMFMRIRQVGTLPNSPITLSKPISLTEVKSPLEGNIVVVKGQKGSGSYPKEPALWRSLIEEFENLPLWDNTITYKRDRYVRYNDAIYQARNNHSNSNITPAAGSSWNVIKFKDYIEDYTGNTDFQYSPWTDDKNGVWKNWCGNAGANSGNSFLANNVPSGADVYDSLCVPDNNLVIRDEKANSWRDWVDFRVASLSDIPSAYLYAATSGSTTTQQRTYFGMRVLVDPNKNTIGSPFTGNDKFGKAYRNAIVIHDRDGDWIVFKTAEQYNMCAVLDEGRVYEYNTPKGQGGVTGNRATRSTTNSSTNLAWRDNSDVMHGNDCFHYPSLFENTDGLIGERSDSIVTLDKTSSTNYTDNSAIKIEYEYGETDEVDDLITILNPLLITLFSYFNEDGTLKTVAADADSDDATVATEDKMFDVETYNIGWWATLFETPYPKSTYNGITEDVGELFGGDADNKVSLLDLRNLNNTPSGQTGYGHVDSDHLGPLDGFKLLFRFNILGLDFSTFKGDIPFRATIYDLLGNVWTSDIALRFQETTQEFDFPFSSFRISRSRVPFSFQKLSTAISIIINPELKITEIFESRLVKRITLQCMLTYDDAGRYDPWTWEGFLRGLVTGFTSTYITYRGEIDAFHFTKTPVAIARDTVTAGSTDSISDRHLNTSIKEYPGISNIAQLQKIANSELDIAKFRQDVWQAKYQNIASLCAEDAVYMQNSDLINESDKTGVDNTRRLIIKKITYSVGSGTANSGFISNVELYREVVAAI